MDIWNEREVILKITKGKPILCFHVSSGTVGFCLPCLRWVNRKQVCVPATALWEDTYTFLWLTISHIPTRPLWKFSSLFLWNVFAHLKEKKSVLKHLPNFISSGHQHKELNISYQNNLFVNAAFSHSGHCDPIFRQEDIMKLNPSDNLRHVTLINQKAKQQVDFLQNNLLFF